MDGGSEGGGMLRDWEMERGWDGRGGRGVQGGPR